MTSTNSAATLAANQIQILVTENVTENGKTVRKPVGHAVFYCPSLKDFGLDVEPTGRDAQTGELIYEGLELSFLYGAVVAATKAHARNKLPKGSNVPRAGTSFATNLTELVTPAETSSTILVERNALIGMFKDFMATGPHAGKPENVKKLLVGFLGQPDMLALQPQEQREKIKVYFNDFGLAVEASLTEWQMNHLGTILEVCDGAGVEF